MRKWTERAKLILLVGCEAAAVWTLHRLGRLPWLEVPWHDLSAWVQVSAPEQVVGAALRLAGLAVGYWLLASTALYSLARLSRVPSAIRAVEWATLPAVRRAADRALALSLAASILSTAGAASAAAAPASRPDAVVRSLAAGPATTQPTGRPPPPQPTATATGQPAATTRAPTPPGPTPTPRLESEAGRPTAGDERAVHRVVAGDNLWTIAAARVARATGRAPGQLTDAEIAAYWRLVVAANHDRLRSGDPDLIYPGEDVVLPPMGPEPPRGASR